MKTFRLKHRLRGLIIAATTLFGIAIKADGQLYYAHTDFLHGFASSAHIWIDVSPFLNGQSVLSYLTKTIDLGTVNWYSFDSTKAVNDWRTTYAPTLQPDGHVLVGHSTGVLLARSTFVIDTALRPRIRAIVAFAAPHQGTVLADSALKARDYIDETVSRINLIQDIIKFVKVAGYIYGQPLVHWITGVKTPDVSKLQNLPALPALRDLSPTSDLVTLLKNNTEDAVIPRANIIAQIPLQDASVKVMAAIVGQDENDLIKQKNDGIKKLRTCKNVGLFTILVSPLGGGSVATLCNRALVMLTGLDDAWGRYVNGSVNQTYSVYAPGIGNVTLTRHVARNVPFDGVVSNERQVYPGLTDPNFNLQPLKDLNHENIYNTTRGLDAASAVMLRLPMRQPTPQSSGPLGASLSGPTSVRPSTNCLWAATGTGGGTPYHYAWVVNGAHIGMDAPSTYYTSASSTFNISVTVTDYFGTQVTASRVVTVSSSAPVCPA